MEKEASQSERGVNMSVEAGTHLHSGVVSGRHCRSPVGFDVVFEQSEPQVHLFLAATVDDDGIKADPCDTYRKGKCHPSSAFPRQPEGAEKSARRVSSICFLCGCDRLLQCVQ